MTVFRSLIIFAACSMTTAYGDAWKESGINGWLWYKAQPKRKGPPKAEKTVTGPQGPKELTYRERLKKEQEEFEEIQAKAVVEPTLENVQAMQRAQNNLVDQASAFQKLWMLASLLNAQNYHEAAQPYPIHRKLYQEKEEKKLTQQIRQLARNFGIFFIFKKECPFCHEFAPIVREFIDTYGFEYKAISPDGSPLPQFTDAVADNGTLAVINPEGIYPALFLVNPQTREVVPLSRGLVNSDELRSNMKLIIESLGRLRDGE